MKLRNKKTGEIIEWEHGLQYKLGKTYGSIKEFAEEWEDYEETKDYWYLNGLGTVIRAVYKTEELTRALVSIGNYFETPEQAEKAVERLHAWKRLKDKGFKFRLYLFDSVNFNDRTSEGKIFFRVSDDMIEQDLDLLFGGEDE